MTQHAQIAALAAGQQMPVMFGYRQGPAAGGLVSYGASIPEAYRQPRALMLAASSRAKSPPTCRYCSPPGSS